MKFKSATVKDFRRFTDLTVSDIPETVQLIMLAGPNGCGKSSFFDALHIWHQHASDRGIEWDNDYHSKVSSQTDHNWTPEKVSVEFHDVTGLTQKRVRKAVYFRTAYRNDPDFQVSNLSRVGDPFDERRVNRMIDNDEAVSRNYQKLASQGLEDLFSREEGATTFDQYREKSIGEIAQPLLQLFSNLELNSLGNPLEDGTFHFTKGASRGFSFKNLSGGEKAAFDLILDLVVVRRYYNDTLYCIDEPESHMNARLQAKLLTVLYNLVPENCQLMLATHSIGMMRRARDIEAANPGSVVFLDFEGLDFDVPQKITPTAPDRTFWKSAYDIALDDLAELVAPERVVICEGEPSRRQSSKNYAHDAQCYESIFNAEFPETQFIPGGNADEVAEDKRGIAHALGILTRGVDVVRLIDLDDLSTTQVDELSDMGVQVLSKRNLESYLFSDEVLAALAVSVGLEERVSDLLAEKQRIADARTDNGQPDDLKPLARNIRDACKRILNVTQGGNDTRAFMRDTLAPLIKPGMSVYTELKRDIFGSKDDPVP